MSSRIIHASTLLLIFIGAQGLASVEALKSTATPIEVGGKTQLLIDTFFFESSNNITLHCHPATKTGERTIETDRSWEDATLNWFTLLDDEGKYRMWYEAYDVEGWPSTDDTSFCYAESTDGIIWNKPSLGLYSFYGSTDNNILFRQVGEGSSLSRVHGTCVYIDPTASEEARYKAVSQGQFSSFDPPYKIAGMYSPDGFHWTRFPQPICNLFGDSQYSGFWDESIHQYVLYGRVSGHGRSIGRSTSTDFSHFDPLTLVFQTSSPDPSDSELYNPAALKYPYADNIYLMFPSFYRTSTETLEIYLAVSRDGVNWSWAERGVAFIPLGPSGSFDSGSLYMGQGLIRHGNEIWLYYSGSPLKHNEVDLDTLANPANKRVYSRVISRLDGFVSADAGDAEGGFTTPPLSFSGTSLHLNVTTGTTGEIRAGLLDASGNAIAGFGIEDCTPITGDHIDAMVTWKSGADITHLVGTPLKLVVKMKNASLYSFRFSTVSQSSEVDMTNTILYK